MGKKIIAILHSKNVYLELGLQVDQNVRVSGFDFFNLLNHSPIQNQHWDHSFEYIVCHCRIYIR